MPKIYTVEKDYQNSRFDRWFKAKIINLPQSLIEKIIRLNKVKINKKRAKSSYRVQSGDIVEVYDISKFKINDRIRVLKYKPSSKEVKVYDNYVPCNQKLTLAETETKEVQFLYQDKDLYIFMDNKDFEQYELNSKLIGDNSKYLSEGSNAEIITMNSNALAIQLPSSMILTIAETEVGLKGDTQSGATKPAKTTTGLTVQVPLFIESGQKINVSTSDGSYLGRSD